MVSGQYIAAGSAEAVFSGNWTDGGARPAKNFEFSQKICTMTQRELADCCFVDVTTISRTVDRLVAAGLLSKQIDPECRRSCLISLTEEGRKKAVQVQHIFEKGDEIWWKSFDEEELERLYQYLLKMEQSLKGDQGK